MSLGSASESWKVEGAVEVDADIEPPGVVLLSFFAIAISRARKRTRMKRRVTKCVVRAAGDSLNGGGSLGGGLWRGCFGVDDEQGQAFKRLGLARHI